MTMFRDNQGNPVILTPDQILQRGFDPSEANGPDAYKVEVSGTKKTTTITINFANYPLASTNYLIMSKVLNPLAKKRLFVISADPTVSNYVTVSLFIADSSANANPGAVPADANHYRINNIPSIANVDGGYPAFISSGGYALLADPGDTLAITIGTGSTPNTSGNLYIQVIEQLGT